VGLFGQAARRDGDASMVTPRQAALQERRQFTSTPPAAPGSRSGPAARTIKRLSPLSARSCRRVRPWPKDLERLLDRKDSVHYGTTMISPAEGTRMVGWAARLVEHAHAAVEA
jgi:hypothetical protein